MFAIDESRRQVYKHVTLNKDRSPGMDYNNANNLKEKDKTWVDTVAKHY